jgi:hypothetical protein
MKFTTALLGLAAQVALGKEMPKDPVRAAELYDNGEMHMKIMNRKESFWASRREMRLFAEEWPELHFAQCKDGKVVPFRDQPDNFYRCNNVSEFPLSSSVLLARLQPG